MKLNNSRIQANGQFGKQGNIDEEGSGGGSGGSIELTTNVLVGDSIISVKGGSGSQNEGGGGSGGRIVMNYLKSYLISSYPSMSIDWYGHADVEGGPPGRLSNYYQDPGAGENGTMMGSKCMPGFSGIFCKPCPVGTFNSEFGYGACEPCQNKPKNSYYNLIG